MLLQFILISIVLFHALFAASEGISWKLNTSNPGKLKEFQRLFAKYSIDLFVTTVDLEEIESDPIQVMAHKASQLDEFILTEDTSLDIEGAEVGVNVRWLMNHLDQYAGRKAIWTVFLAYRRGDEVLIYKGEIKGVIVRSHGEGGFGFDPVFLPDGAKQTLAQSKTDEFNARALAVEALLKGEKFMTVKAIYHWEGPWQNPEDGR